ncbi:MAG: sugar ABC transporter permease [Anaerolineales bacterium]|nr:sugar ABC transporter permease [Anaerolineales bacterium]
MSALRRFALVSIILLVGFVALGLRLRAVSLLPIDYDEDDYLAAAQRYAHWIRAGDLQPIIDYSYNYEHPPLTKIFYALAILPLPEVNYLSETSPSLPPVGSLPQPHFRNSRLISAVLGSLEALALAITNPLAGFFLAIQTWQIKYTSQIMLEPLPAFFSLLAVIFYSWALKESWLPGMGAQVSPRVRHRSIFWLCLSAVSLGLTAASKYTYCVAGIAILVDWLWRIRDETPDNGKKTGNWYSILFVLAWGILAVIVFFAFNPRLWNDPLGRLTQSILYHGDYAASEHVRQVNFPAWQPLVWLAGSVPWHPGVFLVSLDLYITLLAGIGLQRLWDRQRVYGLWLAIGLVFLLLWPTKWPQYILILTAPLSLAAAHGFQAFLWEPLIRWRERRRASNRQPAAEELAFQQHLARRLGWRDLRRALPWLLPGALTLTVIALFPLIYQGAMSLTDFNAISIRDGIQGGVWRAVWEGLTLQQKPVIFDPFEGTRSQEVKFTGPFILLALIGGAAPELLAFNVLWTVLSVALQAALGILVALALHRQGLRLANVWRTIFILPWAVPEFVGALIWLRLLEPRSGWLMISQQLPAGVAISNWLDDPNMTLLLLLVAATWYGFPFIMLAAAAGLKLVPEEVFDAAAIDGAGSWSLFRDVTWPLLFPLVAPAIIIRSIFAFNQFYLFYTMRVNFPTLTYATVSYFYFAPGLGGQFAVSAAINIFTVLVLVVLILWFNRVSRAAEGVTYA